MVTIKLSLMGGTQQVMRDIDIRRALKKDVLRRHINNPKTLVLDELGLLHGSVRVDVAVVNGMLHGFEIKSDVDSLDRLPNQIDTYGKVLDRATLIVGVKHFEKANEMLPEWWGVKLVKQGSRGGIKFKEIRGNCRNPDISKFALASLLWSDEARSILLDHGMLAKDLRKPRAHLYQLLADMMPLTDLRGLVRDALKKRENWRK